MSTHVGARMDAIIERLERMQQDPAQDKNPKLITGMNALLGAWIIERVMRADEAEQDAVLTVCEALIEMAAQGAKP